MSNRNILLCVAGMTPQIITETLWALRERGERVDEIRVITTIGGRDKLKKALLDEPNARFYAFCRDYGLEPAAIKFDETTIALLRTPDGLTLADIRTPQENEYAGDQICDIVRALCQDPDVRLHASAAGGRKTMSIYLTAAMQLFGRADDALSHVLVGLSEDAPPDYRNEDFELNPNFYYPPPTPCQLDVKDRNGQVIKQVSTAYARIYLADIPFIRLRGISFEASQQAGPRVYGEMVKQAQTDLDFFESECDLQVNLRDYTVNAGQRTLKLTPREMFFYAMFADFRQRGRGADDGISLDQLTEEDFTTTFRRIARAHGDGLIGWEEVESFPGFEFWAETMRGQLASQLPDEKKEFRKSFDDTRARIEAKCKNHKFPPDYRLQLRGPRGSARYGLGVPPARIKFTDEP